MKLRDAWKGAEGGLAAVALVFLMACFLFPLQMGAMIAAALALAP